MTHSSQQQTASSSVPGLGVIIMAAGLGKRMKSSLAKVLHPVAGRPMVRYVLDIACRLAEQGVAVVVGHQGADVRKVVESAGAQVAVAEQVQQLGTGHAVLQARPLFTGQPGCRPTRYLILNGDTPLLTESTLRELLAMHDAQGAAVTLLTAVLDDASGYGRVIRRRRDEWLTGAPDNAVQAIVEDKDASDEQRTVRESNVGTYVVDGDFLFPALDRLDPRNAQGEYYLTDIVQTAVRQGKTVAALRLRTIDEGLGINSRVQLAEAERVIRQRIRERWLEAGVTMQDPASTWIDEGVTIGRDTVLSPNVTLEGRTVLGEGVVVHSGTRITDCTIGDRVEILDHCILRESQVEADAHLGPFAHLRPGVLVRRKAKVGNFVEMKKAELGEGSKANHLSYLGDARIGASVNIGAGTITCNYDGWNKFQTVIGDGVFIGSDVQLVAPVNVGAGSIVAAGATVTHNVPADALVISRVPQVTREGWAARRRAMQSGVEPPPAPNAARAEAVSKGTAAAPARRGTRSKKSQQTTVQRTKRR
ncbi:UDP-N-acetylglucosamine diphosphorylase/glucosamine-1-phosphate N-acetyltransferase [Nitrospirales bacterium NOB]|nr:Bifunctional protein GlmU [Nitrospirota bacterium]MCE7966789.1 UDP-N-acetylglucosamine diphosphorylase/glucosamine-1-phosphate N-acetyltransferase [Nitrospira sp. NTP2]MCK6494015.1 bifunctional UDP-N-acetylglucosamine diphosphorylase/glucosamine-1-phosphate N-acetyltransferase GlmU [Nitrospira sp.]MDL1888903.1 UDP-N-acetylglucosamine diphosphorylase/glucosamine-1-phosphate N-acetyltransferase [Nitrospirales bacterium NOB]MEB2339968.1 bifunctional UDP-N-acetylglucosamine diphosphorylase/gluco